MAKSKGKRQRNNNRNNKKSKLGVKPKKKTLIQDHDPALFAGTDDDEALSSERIQQLLDPYTKEQLIGFLTDAAVVDAALLARIRAVADADVSHRKIFVHGLGWDTTTEILLSVFNPYGPIEDCRVITDKATGRSKGYGFVLFRDRAGAVNALKEPEKKIKDRLTHSQLASLGPIGAAGGSNAEGREGRRVYVSNVHADATPDKLKTFFSKFGEIEAGPFGFDMVTGKSRGYALFIYKTQEGAKRALEEPYKMFEGHQLHCSKATDPANKAKTPITTPALNPAALFGATHQTLAAVAAAQNLALYGQNPAYAALLGQNPLLMAALNPAAAAAFNPAAVAALNPAAAAALSLAPQGQQQYGGTGIGTASPSVLGAYGSQYGLQDLQSYQNSQLGQSSSLRPGSSYGGYNSYLCACQSGEFLSITVHNLLFRSVAMILQVRLEKQSMILVDTDMEVRVLRRTQVSDTANIQNQGTGTLGYTSCTYFPCSGFSMGGNNERPIQLSFS